MKRMIVTHERRQDGAWEFRSYRATVLDAETPQEGAEKYASIISHPELFLDMEAPEGGLREVGVVEMIPLGELNGGPSNFIASGPDRKYEAEGFQELFGYYGKPITVQLAEGEAEERLTFYVPDYPAVRGRLEEAYARFGVSEHSAEPGRVRDRQADADVQVRGPKTKVLDFRAWLEEGQAIPGLRLHRKPEDVAGLERSLVEASRAVREGLQRRVVEPNWDLGAEEKLEGQVRSAAAMVMPQFWEALSPEETRELKTLLDAFAADRQIVMATRFTESPTLRRLHQRLKEAP